MEHRKELCDTQAISNEAVLIVRDEARNMMVEIVAYTALECFAYNGITRNCRHGCLHFLNKLTVHVITVP